MATKRTQLASVTFVRPAACLTGHIFNTANHIALGLRLCAFVSSGAPVFTRATLHLNLAAHNPTDQFILPHGLKQLDTFSAG